MTSIQRLPVLLCIVILITILNLSAGKTDVSIGSETQYKKLPLVEWQRDEILQFISNEFADYEDLFRMEIDDKNYSGSDLLLLEEDDLIQMGIDDENTRSRLIKKIQQLANQVNDEEDLLDIEAYQLVEDRDLPSHKRRFDLDKLEQKHLRSFIYYAFLWMSSPSSTFIYMYFRDANFLKIMLHLPTDHEFTVVDFVKYIFFGRIMIIKELWEFGYTQQRPIIIASQLIGHAISFLGNLLAIFYFRSFNPLAGISSALISSSVLYYLLPELALSWYLFAPILALQGIMNIVRILTESQLKKLQTQLAAQKLQQQETMNEITTSTNNNADNQEDKKKLD